MLYQLFLTSICKVIGRYEFSPTGQVFLFKFAKRLLDMHGYTLVQFHISLLHHIHLFLPLLAASALNLRILSLNNTFNEDDLSVKPIVFPPPRTLEARSELLQAILSLGTERHPLPDLRHLRLKLELATWTISDSGIHIPPVEILGFGCNDKENVVKIASIYGSSLQALVMAALNLTRSIRDSDIHFSQLIIGCLRIQELRVYDNDSECGGIGLLSFISRAANLRRRCVFGFTIARRLWILTHYFGWPTNWSSVASWIQHIKMSTVLLPLARVTPGQRTEEKRMYRGSRQRAVIGRYSR